MYLSSCVPDVVLSVVCYFSDLGHALFMFFCFVLPFFVIVQVQGPSKLERSSQTDSTSEEAGGVPQQKSETGLIAGSDEPDTAIRTVQKISYQSQYRNIQRSLQHMFKCAYTHLILPWSIPAEPGDCPPLHTAVLTEFNSITDGIISKIKDLDLTVIVLGCIQIITQHLHNIKESEGSPAFNSKAEEIAVVRDLCQALIHNLFPKHLWEPNVYYCVLHEILSVKVLTLVTLLSDPDNLNHLIVSQLDKLEEVQAPDRDPTLSRLQEETMAQPSKKGTVKKKVKLFFQSLKPNQKKDEIKRKKTVQKRIPAALNDDISNSDNSLSDSLETDDESLTGIQEFMTELFYERWKVGKWTVTITNMEGNELCYTVHVEERDNPENLHWDVRKNQSDIDKFFRQCEEMPRFSSLKQKSEQDMHGKREILEDLLKVVMQNADLGHSDLVFKFLCPIDLILLEEENDHGVLALLKEIDFLTKKQEDGELRDIKVENERHDLMYKCNTSEVTLQHELDDTQTETTDNQDQEIEDDLLETDGGHSPTPPPMSTSMSTQEQTRETDHLCDQAEEHRVGIERVGVNAAEFADSIKDPEFHHNFRRQASAFSSSKKGKDSLSLYTNDTVSICDYNSKRSNEENLPNRKSPETEYVRQEKNSTPKEKTPSWTSGEKKTSNPWEQPEACKVILDLLKEITGNSVRFILIKTFLTPFSSMITKKVEGYLKKMYPSEAQIATYIESLCENLWPDKEVEQPLPESSDDKNKTEHKALQILTSKFAGFGVVSISDVKRIFKIFQNTEGNKKLIYMLLPHLLRAFLHEELDFNVMSKLNVKSVNNLNGQF